MKMSRMLLSAFLFWSLKVEAKFNTTIATTGPKCKELGDLFSRTPRYVSIFGTVRSVSVLYGARAPSRAAAALLAAVLQQALRYRNVAFRPGPRSLCELARSYPDLRDRDADYDEMVVHVGAEWTKQDDTCEALHRCDQRDLCGAAGPRFNVMGPSPAPMTLRLYARLTPAAWHDAACAGAHAWPFYANLSATIRCGFNLDVPAGLQIVDHISTVECLSSSHACLPVLIPPDWNTTYETAHALAESVSTLRLPLRIVPLPNDVILRYLLKEEHLNISLLFMDYELGDDARDSKMHVLRVQPPPPEIEPVKAVRVADAFFLRQFAPRLLDAFSRLSFHRYELRDVLEREAKGLHIKEAACEHALKNINRFDVWRKANEPQLWAYVMLCDDPDYNEYLRVIEAVGNAMKLTNSLQVSLNSIKCGDENHLNQILISMMKDLRYVRLAGAIGAGEGAAATAYSANLTETQLVLYDVPPDAARLGSATRVAAGRLDQLVYGTYYFFAANCWRRIAVISEKNSHLARDFALRLAKYDTLALGERFLETVNKESATNALRSLFDENARVFFINTGPAGASRILCEALHLGLTPDKGYVWIVREWRNWSCDLESRNMTHFTVSYWWRGGDDSALSEASGSALLRRTLDTLWPGQTWPMLAAPLADALVLLDYVTNAGLQRNPSRRYDLHGYNATREFAEGFSVSRPPTGVVQELRQSQFALDAPLVFVDAWRGGARQLEAIWRVNGSTVYSLKKLNAAIPVWDGSRRCYTKLTGDAFSPTCHDGAVAVLVIILAVTPAALWMAARLRAARLAARDRALHVRLMARCERTAGALAEFLVDRRALELHEELGAGHFGRVRRGTLRLPHRPPMPVAVKALRGDAAPAEEAEFLREACALAALGAHAHVVRLVRVCAADGPPLLLMEHAFFGDLARYLRERRHLAELGDDELNKPKDATEASHVSARALSRLGGEAAAALAHVARARFVHRDVRAANCLVDHQRTLKLADFGMARAISSQAIPNEENHEKNNSGEEYLYVCRRRGVFPVPWMAPESLQRGVFSAASDVWALGVLLLEMATLGARPFAAWRPPRVLRHVRAGGHPPLPRDASYHTCEIIEMCWRTAPDARPSAAAVQEYLTQHPLALRPALRPAWLENDDDEQQGDSGFGERDPKLESDPHISTL